MIRSNCQPELRKQERAGERGRQPARLSYLSAFLLGTREPHGGETYKGRTAGRGRASLLRFKEGRSVGSGQISGKLLSLLRAKGGEARGESPFAPSHGSERQ